MCLRILFSRILSLSSTLWSAAARLPLFRLLTTLHPFRSSISSRTAVISAALFLVAAPAFSQNQPFTNHLLERAQSGHVQEQLEVARAFQLGLGVDRNPAEAARWLHKAADQGSPAAQCQLGFLYHTGSGVERDDREAFRWFQRAALENYAPAQFDLALLLLQGIGTSQDQLQAVHWMMRAAKQGFPQAQTDLGILYLSGYGVPVDQAEGLRWLRKAAKRHCAPAEFAMGTLYRTPSVSGLENNPAMAARWYRKAAAQGYAPAQNNLAVLYANGVGVPADTEEARKWYRLAAEQGYGGAAANLARNYADPNRGKYDLASAYFWALVSLHYSTVLNPLPPSDAVKLRARLSSEEATRIEAQAQDWEKVHPLSPDTAHDDWFTYLFTQSNAAPPQ